MFGWVVAALQLGFVAGVLFAWRYLYNRPAAPKPEPAPQQAAQPAVVYTPVEPEALAQAVITDGAKERMLEDFQTTYGLSFEDSKRAVEEMIDRVQRIGAQTAW